MKNGQLPRYGDRFSRLDKNTKIQKNFDSSEIPKTVPPVGNFCFQSFEINLALVQNRLNLQRDLCVPATSVKSR